jgi:hypothetical protein
MTILSATQSLKLLHGFRIVGACLVKKAERLEHSVAARIVLSNAGPLGFLHCKSLCSYIVVIWLVVCSYVMDDTVYPAHCKNAAMYAEAKICLRFH